MTAAAKQIPVGFNAIHKLVGEHARELSEKLQAHRHQLFPPTARKTLRRFTSGEVANLIGVDPGYLRRLTLEGRGPQPDLSPSGRRSYSIEDIHALRAYLDESGKAERRYLPRRRQSDHLQVIAVVNFKGGSGKTTTSAHLAQYLALRGYRTLAIDLDPQASLSALHGYQPEFDIGENETLYGALRYDEHRRPLSSVIRETYFPGLDLVPANIELMDYEHDTPKALVDRNREELFFTRLDGALAEVQDRYDVVVIDTPPALGLITVNALVAATHLLVPIQSSYFALEGTDDLLETIDKIKARPNPNLQLLGVVITMHDKRTTLSKDIHEQIGQVFGSRLFNTVITKSIRLEESPAYKESIFTFAPRSSGAMEYYSLSEEILSRV